MSPAFDVGQCATLACLLEVTVPKPGNVHRGADFVDLTFADFAAAAVAIAPAMSAAAAGLSLGACVHQAIAATRLVCATNVNLGIVLLLTPLAAASRRGRSLEELRHGVSEVLRNLTPADAAEVYAAIALAQPGGMGKVSEADVADAPPSDLLHAMRLAAERDSVARQYADDFRELFELVVPTLDAHLTAGRGAADAVIRTFLHVLHTLPDSLIARKCGVAAAQEVSVAAGQVLEAGQSDDEVFHETLADFDFWLRSDGHRRNPGTTADLLAAALFALLLADRIPRPFRL
ncbi:MAG: triphosphoribosyl-dephospho-CoA synthase [Pirellulales bacterium]